MFLEGEDWLFLLFDPEELLEAESLPFFLTLSRMEMRMVSTSPKYGRRSGSPSQHDVINCQHGSVKDGNFSGRKPARVITKY